MNERTVAVVVGVGPGLGAAVAERFAREKFAVALMARNEATLAPVEGAIVQAGGSALPVPADVSDPTSLRAAFARVRERLGAPDVFVYNAGAFHLAGVLDTEVADFEQCWRVGCLGAFVGAQEVLPAMLERGRGTLLFTGATASLRGGVRFAAFSGGKFALRALAQSLAREFGPRGIHVAHAIIDGAIDTPRIRAFLPDRETHTLLSPAAIAEAYWQLHTQDPSAWTHELDLRPAVETF